VSAYALADAVEKHGDDLRALVLELESVIESRLAPWLKMQMRQDEAAIELNQALRRGEDPYQIERPDGTRDERAYLRTVLREGLAPAMRSNLDMMRRFMRVAHMLDSPSDVLADPSVMKQVLASYETRHEREPLARGPSRPEMLDIIAAA
jgi:hypothetical protein